MSVERLVGVQVTDDREYEQYRRQLAPLLLAAGGQFVVDLRVSEVLTAPAGAQINRLFVLRFASAEAMQTLFESAAYLAVREAHLVSSVAEVTMLANYQVAE